MNIYYVYVYLNPNKPGKFTYGKYEFEFEPFYIGKGKNNRLKNHLLPKYLKNNSEKSKIINEILNNNKIPLIIKYVENVSSNEAYIIEKDMIENIGMINKNSGPLTNIMAKSHGRNCHSVETIEKIRKTSLGRKHSEETKKRLSLAKMGNKNPMYKDGNARIRKKSLLGASGCKLGILNPMYGRKLTDNQKLLRSINSPKRKTYEITHKNGLKEIITGLSKYCRDNNLSYRSFRKVLYGERNHYKHMTIKEIKNPA